MHLIVTILWFCFEQDPNLKDELRLIPGQPLLFIAYNAMTMETPAGISRDSATSQVEEKIAPTDHAKSVLDQLKVETFGEPEVRKKRKRKQKGPNPLSCKKSKKKKQIPQVSNGGVKKRRRKKNKKNLDLSVSAISESWCITMPKIVLQFICCHLHGLVMLWQGNIKYLHFISFYPSLSLHQLIHLPRIKCNSSIDLC